MASVGALRTKAAEVRQLADTSTDSLVKWQLASLAQQFERLADEVERRRTPAPLNAPSRSPLPAPASGPSAG